MAFCGKCGIQVGEGVNFCPGCGAPMTVSQGTAQQATATQPNTANQETVQQGAAPQNDFMSKIQKLNDTTDNTAEFSEQDIQTNKTMALLSYLSILVLVPLFGSKDSKFARFHANQGLVLCIFEIIYGIAYGILTSIILSISWRLYFLTQILGFVSLVFIVVSIIGIINAAGGKAKELPIIGKIKILR